MRTTGFLKTTEGKNYLLCDGSEVPSTYPKLRALMTHTPNLSDRVPWGAGTFNPGKYLDAGLPNITGHFDADVSWHNTRGGAFYDGGTRNTVGTEDHGGTDLFRTYFDASRSNPIYGKSDTVRPPSLVVQFYIRAK